MANAKNSGLGISFESSTPSTGSCERAEKPERNLPADSSRVSQRLMGLIAITNWPASTVLKIDGNLRCLFRTETGCRFSPGEGNTMKSKALAASFDSREMTENRDKECRPGARSASSFLADRNVLVDQTMVNDFGPRISRWQRYFQSCDCLTWAPVAASNTVI
jgi:hypothetical protein